jgi:hypothetical protein
MEARQAYKMIQWYRVYSGEVFGDNEDHSIYISLLDSFIDCHDMIEEAGMTYHQYYHYCLALQEIQYPDDNDIAFEESLLD